MRRLVLTLATAAIVSLACGIVRADWYGDYYTPAYTPNYGYQVNNSYYGGWQQPSCSSPESYAEAARRIKAAHSRYRYFTHPLSLQNSPPTQADYYGWGY
jgi:hypothetical protein